RAGLWRLDETEHVLLFALHHIVSDGWSLGVLVREVTALYAVLAEEDTTERPSPLPELPVQYADFAAWQRSWLSGDVLEGELQYWRDRLSGAPPVFALPTDRPRPAVQSFRGAVRPLSLSPALSAALTDLSWRQGATLFMTLASAFSALLSRLTGQDDFTLGTVVAGRRHLETESLIGFFVNTLVLRPDLSATPRFTDLLARVRREALDAYAHQDLPFEKLVEDLAPERSLAHTPLFQVMFAWQNAAMSGISETVAASATSATSAMGEPAMPGLRLVPVQIVDEVAKFDLTLSLNEAGGKIAGSLSYALDLFDAPTIDRLAAAFSVLLAAVVENPALPVSHLPLLGPGERHQLVVEWNDTQASFPGATLLHQFFEAAVERTPEAIAAVYAGRELTYAELETRSNRLAHLLRALGVWRGAPVGVWVERSFDMLTAVLAILKAGGHYVALDEAWPADRVESILAATGAPALVAGSGQLGRAEEMRWRLPALSDVVCLAVADPEPPAEAVDADNVRELWDFVAERAVDRVTAGGFISAFTGLPFSEAEVDEYRDRVLSLAAPWLHPRARVLEIGNGSGLLLWELAARVAKITGVDPSERTQERNRERAAEDGWNNVELLTGFAHELEDLIGPIGSNRFDLILLASTVQFFPGPRYLERVVRWALRRLAPGGALLIADVLDARRRDELERAIGESAGAPVRRRELYLDEDQFHGFGTAAVHHRHEGFPNELRFRYDVLLTAGEGVPRKRLWTGWHADHSADGRLPAVASPDDIAYVIHTSGSTGEPKGIVVQHRPAANLVDWINRTFAVGPDDRGLFITSLAFDLSVYDIFGLLAAGGTVHVASGEEIGDPARLVKLLCTAGITLWDSAPAALVQLAPLFPATPDPASRLRRVLLSGDWIPVTLPDRVRQAFPGAQVLALGGATEATVWSNWFPVEVVDPSWPSIPYGRPISNARYHVLDGAFSPCPISIQGDLYIGGDCLCSGYARRPELTAAAFLPDPFAAMPGARLYRTGDRARYGIDGNLEFQGRLDQQVKVRGYRIELGEIEVALTRHPGVREAVVLVRQDKPGDQRLVAYVVPAAEPAPSSAELRETLRQVLPEYMIPAAFVSLAELPVTANGKLDRQALPAPVVSGGEHRAFHTPVEEITAGLWAELLGLAYVGPDDNFFELGGHSLIGAQLISRLRQALDVELPLRILFEAPTVTGLAAEVERLRRGDGGPALPTISSFRQDRGAPPPLSFAQERYWAGRHLEARSVASTIPMLMHLEGPLDRACLWRAITAVVDRHELLRTSFRDDPEGPVQVIHPTVSVALPEVGLERLGAAEQRAEVKRFSILDGRLHFDYERPPFFRSTLFRCGAEEHILLFTIHHVALDWWSRSVMLREVAALYLAFRAGQPSPLPPLVAQFQDFARWQRRLSREEAQASQVTFWREHLSGAVPIDLGDLSESRPHPRKRTFTAGSEGIQVPEDLERQLDLFSARQGVTLFMTLLAAFKA
ncbi:MAG TPA: amino acid adenylation domain-containing protein, partial [Thermoanaerobaculia bacterium]